MPVFQIAGKHCNKVFCLIGLIFLSLHNIHAQQDRFAQIGATAYDLRKQALIEPAPLQLPSVHLPVGIQGLQPLPFLSKMETSASLYQELDSVRRRFQPFMQDFSKLREDYRRRIPITEMNWRLETAEDEKDFSRVLQGGGSWKQVTIPHYGPPVGHAVAYYSREITLDAEMFSRGSLFVCFKGVDYKAEVFFNGAYCGRHEGFFAPFEFDITKLAKAGKNQLLVKVINEPTTTGSSDGKGGHVVGDKIYAAGGPGWDEPEEGWHICPPGMGIYQDCYIESRPSLFIHDIFVRPLPEKDSAELWLEIYNASQTPTSATLSLSLFGKNFLDTVFQNLTYIPATTVVPGIGDMVKPTDWQQKPLPMEYGANYLRIPIQIKGFRWWNTETPWLYNLHAVLIDTKGKKSDARSSQFGMRSFHMDTVNIPKGRMYLNGQQIRLRGANSMGFEQNDVIRKNWNQLTDDILLARLCNMNFIRFTQRPVQSEVYEHCDMLGMLNQTDLPFFGAARISRFAESVKQAEEMERLIRPHPSAIVVTYMNERFPNAEGSPQRSFSKPSEVMRLFSALDQAVLLSNPDRVIKAGDGDYDPPGPGLPDNHCYNTWYNGHAMDLGKFHKGYWQWIKPDWLYGCGEYGAEGLDPLGVMRKYYPASWLPQNTEEEKTWLPNRISKSQTLNMHHMWYPTQTGIQNWIDASQDFQAWAVKFVTEAFRRDSRNVSSAVHLFIDAWPAGWMKSIMDVDRQPKKAYFTYRNALAPLMVSIRSDRYAWHAGDSAEAELWICNDRNQVPSNAKIGYEVYVDGKLVVRQMTLANIPVNGSQYQGLIRYQVPKLKSRSKGFIRAGIFDSNGNCIHVNEFAFQVLLSPPLHQLDAIFVADSETASAHMAEELNIPAMASWEKAKVCIINRYEDYAKYQDKIDAFVQAGGRAIFSEWPAGKYSIAGTAVQVQPTIMGEYFFANPSPSLLQSRRFQDKDFFMWYDAQKGYIQPLLKKVFRAEGWTPLVVTGLCNFAGEDPSGYLAAAFLNAGKGRYVFTSISLAGRVKENPAAGHFLYEIASK